MRSVPILIMLSVNEIYNNKTTYIIEYSIICVFFFFAGELSNKNFSNQTGLTIEGYNSMCLSSKIYHIMLLSASGA